VIQSAVHDEKREVLLVDTTGCSGKTHFTRIIPHENVGAVVVEGKTPKKRT
jgi:hypothetical protein